MVTQDLDFIMWELLGEVLEIQSTCKLCEGVCRERSYEGVFGAVDIAGCYIDDELLGEPVSIGTCLRVITRSGD